MEHQNSLHISYDHLSKEFFDIYYTYSPSHATRQGLHQFDSSLGHYRRDEINETLMKMKKIQGQVQEINPADMDHQYTLDYHVLMTRMKREIYWLEDWRFWETNPLFYNKVITEGIFNLVSRNFAPQEERLKSLNSRLNDIPDVIDAACQNLSNPPIEYTTQCIEQVCGTIKFLEQLPDVFLEVSDSFLFESFLQSNQRATQALRRFLRFLESDLQQRSNGDFAVGEAELQKILDAEEMIDTPVADILARLYKDLDEIEGRISELQQEIDPETTTTKLLARMREDHPEAAELREVIQAVLREIRANLTDYDLMTIPAEMPDVIVTGMPDYASGGGMMLTPGPFETVAEESYLALQIPKSSWSQDRIDGLWSDFNDYALALLLIHECYPGHHTQFYLQKRLPLFASRDHDSDSNSDGWAEYSKCMMVDHIFAKKSPFYQLGLLQSRRSYIASGIAGIEIHTHQRSLSQASDFLMEKQGRTRANTYIWVLNRAVYYPTHLTYYIGSEMVRKLKDDYRTIRGSDFKLKEFHDCFMSYGLIPIKVIRQDMLGSCDDGILF
jgi:hypothetical protein